MNKLSFIGAGNMGCAMIEGVVKSGLFDAKNIFVSSNTEDKLNRLSSNLGVNTMLDNKRVVTESDVVIIAVKPNVIENVLEEIKSNLNEDCILISVAAGISLNNIEKIIGNDKKICRVMPNTPCLVGEGMSAICPNKNINDEDLNSVKRIFSCFGKASVIDESLIDCVIGVSGSSPAYVFMFMEVMADAAVQSGMKRDMAYEFVGQSVLGSAKMLLETGKHPGELKDMVCSPSGTTIKAVEVLEKYGLRNAVIQAQLECVEKSKEMSLER